MKVLVVGSGGREHALVWKLRREQVEVLVAPGNGGSGATRDVRVTDVEALLELAQTEHVDLTIVGPEAPLAHGAVDRFVAQGLSIFGPTRQAARLEWSKAWTKDFLRRRGVPTPYAEVVETETAARRVIARLGLPVVLKADGLAAGKGVFVARGSDEVDQALDQLFRRCVFGPAASQVLVEELVRGPELSVLAFTDGERMAIMPPARDYKRLLDGDAGPNTGGMGGYTWPSYATDGLLREVEERIMEPTLAGMRSEVQPYRGVLYAGLMLTQDGPVVLEFNCRFGDPECQLIVPLLESSLLEACAWVAEGQLRPERIRWARGRTFGVVLAAPGYPDAPRLGGSITGLDRVPPDVLAFHGGTRRLEDGSLVTDAGRVLTLVGSDRDALYAATAAVSFSGKQLRGDIGAGVDSRVAEQAVVA